MTDTPGRLLSSLSNADGKPPKVGGCVGVFFQLFDWNRRLSGKHLFATKSLPAERPQSNKFNDEKLPMAKLLLIADENRGVFPKHSSSESQSEVGSEKSSDSGSNKKPGVVARLMGLESFPETESASQQSKELFFKQQSQQLKQHNKMNHYQELQMLEDLLQSQPEELRRMACNRRDMRETATASKPFLREEKMPKNTKKAQDPMDKFAKLPLSPKKSGIPFSSILSPSKSNKVAPPIKSQSSRKNSSLLMGAAVKILESGMQSNKARPLLLDRASDSNDKAGQCNNRFHSDLKRSLPSSKSNRQVPKPSNREPHDKQETKKESAKSSTKGGGSSIKEGPTSYKCNTSKQQQVPNISVKVQQSSPKFDEVKTSCEDQASLSEHDDESQSLECDSQASSSKENRNNLVKPQQKPPPRLSRSGSVKEEQPPTPPSRGSLFRSKSVREEAQTPQPLQPCQQDCSEKNTVSTPVTSGGKEVRLKREKRQRSTLQESSPEPSVQKSETVGSRSRKPALDQGRAASSRGNSQETQQKSKPAKQNSRAATQEQNGKSSRLLSYDRIFGNRKQTKSCGNGEASNSEDKAKNSNKEATAKAKDLPAEKKSNDNSLMKSLLRRKPLSKAETVSSSKKKVAGEKPTRSSRDHIQHAYERQTRSGGSSPARNFAKDTTVNFTQRGLCEPNKVETAPEIVAERNESQTSECDSQHQEEEQEQQEQTGTEVLDGPVFDVSPEKLHSGERMQEKVCFGPDMLADKSLEEILKTILSKSLGKQSLGESPLGKGSKTESAVPDSEIREEVQLQSTDDATVIDMDVSPVEAEAVSRCDGQQLDDLPSKVLVFEDDDEKQATTPLALPLDTGDSSKEASGDGGQPSPVSVLDFLQSPFPSEVTTSCEEADEEGKRNLESDAESGVVAEGKTLNAILETYSLSFPDFPEVGLSEETTSCEGQEIEMYVRQVLSASGFANDHSLDSDEEVAAGRIPCTEEIFHRLEKQRAVQGLVEFANGVQFCSRIAETPGSCHKLMYDCIGEALDLVLDPFREENAACSGVTSLRHRPYGEDLVAEVTGYILSWREMTLGMVDDLVEVDMSSASGKWKEFSKEGMEVGVDLERMIFRSIMEDLIFDLVGLRLVRRSPRGLNQQPAVTASMGARKAVTIQQQR